MEEQEHRNILPKGFLLNEYQIESVLGKPGGFGITYLATDTNLRQSVAVKEYLPTEFAVREGRSTVCVRSTSDEEAFEWGLKCFAEEAQVLAQFRHPNIIRVLRFFRENGTAYMVMEYQEGESFAEYLKRLKVIPEEELLTVVLPLLEGLKAIHDHGLLHRDIKPNNIYIREDKSPVLLDFGSARYAIGQKSQSVTSIVSPGYAPLEQYDNDIGEQGPWTDIYALGAVMYCAISGEAPPAATRRAMKDQDPIIPATKIGQGKYQSHLLTAIDWALELNKENRPQNVEAWRRTFAPEPIANRQVIPPIARRPPRLSEARRSLLMGVGIIVILLFVATTGLLIYQYNEFTKERDTRIRLEEQLKKEQIAREQAEKKIIEAEKKLKSAEDKLKSAEDMVEQVKRFEETTQTLEGEVIYVNKYHNVTRVKSNDTLNIRALPGVSNEVIGAIPPREMCVLYIGGYRLISGDSIWIKIRYKNTEGKNIEGWVNSYYLALADDRVCKDKDSNNDQESKKTE